ncbi:MAG TPA: transglycosylase SLT domain-containing protein [Candidatus Paceibacterota bacterium]|nr:transglycosylase SLT domain-containing protein [Candidatus Paceibacterota bacterium]
MRKVLAISAVLAVAFIPAVALAAPSWLPLVQCGRAVAGSQTPVPCTPCDFFGLFSRLLDMILYGITGPIAAFIIVIAGGMMLLGGANPAQFQQGKKLLTNTLYGVAIILFSWLFTNFLLNSLGTGTPTAPWNTFTCPAELQAISAIDTQFPPQGPTPATPAPVAPQPNANVGVPSAETRQDLCGMTQPNGKPYICNFTTVPPNHDGCKNINLDGKATIGTYLAQYGGADANALNAIMFAESSCKPSANGGAGAYGLMQLKPDTARKFQQACDVYYRCADGSYQKKDSATGKAIPCPENAGTPTLSGTQTAGQIAATQVGDKVPIPITAGFLLSPSSTQYVVCLGAKFYASLKTSCGTNVRNIAAGYNAGPGYCGLSVDCPGAQSCAGGPMQKWECPWDDRAHTVPNTGLLETRGYAPKVAYCALH